MDRLEVLENRSITILREAYRAFPRLGMMWSIGKDSTVLLWMARKAFLGRVPFPLIHIDTSYEIPELIEYRDRLVREWKLELIVGSHERAIAEGRTFPKGALDRLACCGLLRTQAFKDTVSGEGPRYRLDPDSGELEPYPDRAPFEGLILGIRADEEGTRSKERVFSPRDRSHRWDIENQPPEIWDQYKTDFAPGTHVRVHPLLDWTELNIWEYVERHSIPMVSLYFDQNRQGKRYRSLGCYPCTASIDSHSSTPGAIIQELTEGRLARIAERSGRAQDLDDGGGLESLRRDGYM